MNRQLNESQVEKKLNTQNKERAILSLKKEPMLHILINPLESQRATACNAFS